MKRNLFILIIVLTAICGDTAAQDLKEKVSNYFPVTYSLSTGEVELAS